MTRPSFALTLCLALSASLVCTARAQQPANPQPKTTAAQPAAAPRAKEEPSVIAPDRPDASPEQVGELLGPEFESRGHGIALRPFKDGQAIRRVGTTSVIEFVDDDRDWTLKVSKIVLSEPGNLTEAPDSRGNVQPGVLEFTANRLKEEIPDAEFVRREKINIGDGDVGMIALRYTRNLKSLLSQQAIIQRTDQMYYLLSLTTPGAPRGSAEAAATPVEGPAVRTFQEILDSVRFLDQAAVRRDQDERLMRTRGILASLTPERIGEVLRPQRWLRVIRNGKDVGYTYVEEKVISKGGQDGVEVRMRSRMLPRPGIQVDTGSILFSSMDLRHEDWQTLADHADLKQRAARKDYNPPQVAEVGVSDRQRGPAGRGDVWNLRVVFESTTERVDPVSRPLAPFYVPHAVSHLLPRLMPLKKSRPWTCMFYVWVPEAREVMLRFLDVLPAQRVVFNNEPMVAVRVEDRLGLEGPVTTHYLSPKGEWMGCESKDSGVVIVPTTEQALLETWKDADLTRPEDRREPEGADALRDAAAAAEPPAASGSDKQAPPVRGAAGRRTPGRQ